MKMAMQVEERTLFRRIDVNYMLVIFALNIVGLINLYSATHGINASDVSRLFVQQIIWLVVGWGLFFLVTLVDYQIFFRIAYFFYFLNLIGLGLVTVIGKVSLGAQRWLDLGFFRYQPSETMKLALIVVLARIFSMSGRPQGLGFKELAYPVLLIGLPFFLTVEQPDLGTALLLAAISFSLLFFVRIRRGILIGVLSVLIVAVPVAWSFVLKDYQKNRILTFLSPGRDPQGAGYNSIQSRIAVGSGRVLGKGFRKGTQSQLEFLPERHTDFIFSVLSEEHGFIGSLTTVALFVLLLIMGIRTASQSRDRFGALLTVGVLGYIFFHVFINIGMVIGLLPIVGVPLPLLSYGGSSMLTTMMALGLISSVAYRKFLF